MYYLRRYLREIKLRRYVVVSVESLWNIFRRYFRTNEGTFVRKYILSSYGSTFVRKYLWFVGLSLKTQSIIHLITSHHIKSCIQIEERSTSLRLRRPETPSFDTYIRVGSPEDDLKMTVTNFFSCYFYALTNISAQYYELYRRSTLGMTLTDALDEMVTNFELTPSVAMKVLVQFDKVRVVPCAAFTQLHVSSP